MDNSDEEVHPPYEREAQAMPEETSTRHTAGGDVLRRTTSAAVREIRALSASATVGRDSGVVQQSPDRDSISTAGLNEVRLVADQFQGLQLDQPESQVYGLRVSADHVPVDLARLASGDAELFEGQELDWCFSGGAETVRNSERTNVADMGLPHAQVNARDVAQQSAQSGPMTAETGALQFSCYLTIARRCRNV